MASAAEASGTNAVETVPDNSQLVAAQVKKPCQFCGVESPISSGRTRGSWFACQSCETVNKALRRGFGQLPSELQTFSTQDTESFYREMHKKRQAASNGRLTWETIKATVTTSLCEKEIQEHKQKVKGKYLPEEVWVKKGWSKDTIHQADSEWNEKLKVRTYRVDVKELSWSDVFQQVTQRLLVLEEAVKAKGKGKQAKELGLPGGSAQAQDPAEAEDKARSRHNQKVLGEARKTLPSLTQAACTLQAALETLSQLPQGSQEGLETAVKELLGQVESDKRLCEEVMCRSDQARDAERLPEIVDFATTKARGKAATAMVKDV